MCKTLWNIFGTKGLLTQELDEGQWIQMLEKYGYRKDFLQNFVFGAQKKMKSNKFCDVTLISEDNRVYGTQS